MKYYTRIPVWENIERRNLLMKFRNLLVEYYNNVRPASFLSVTENQRASEIRPQINLILDKSRQTLLSAGVHPSIVYTPPPAIGGYVQSIDLTMNLFNLAHYTIPPQTVLDYVDRAIGVYDGDWGNARLRTFNPLFWVAMLIEYLAGLPFKILGLVGFSESRMQASFLGKLIKGLFQIVIWVAALLTVFEKLGCLNSFNQFVHKVVAIFK